ncbi:NUDIX hydrolase [Bacillus halotolerans]|uniref:NUDIX hydrolase n=1 Tax=Bacillus halotolerans TaxID=260554 RepID=UPI000D042514|nr:NUDIX hydrolase [Bacillus halotolerans]PRP56358.1 ADP-ribose pyrophosphatase [Bacillus halotolerans]
MINVQTKWLERAQRIQAIAQAGLAFSKDVYDRERYEELMKLSAEMMEDYSEKDIEVITDLWKGEKGYPTPKADVRGAVFRENRILLVREKHDELWSLPGGFCEIGLSPAENVIKEIKEESGYDTVPSRLLAVLDSHKHPHPPQPYHYYKIFIECSITGGQQKTGIETNHAAFFPEDRLPPLSPKRNTQSQLSMLFDFQRHPDKKTVFD